jgi:GNAT superfamily N-acetyltransferase
MSQQLSGPIRLENADTDAVTRVLVDAFYDYPVMRYVLSDSADYDRDLQRLIDLFVMARVLRSDAIYGVRQGSELVAVATTSTPTDGKPEPAAFEGLREAAWAELGAAARARYTRCTDAWEPLTVHVPQIHINMLGVLRSRHGQGLGRLLLDRVHAASEADGGSEGVTLTTEIVANVQLYQHFGYEIVGRVDVAPGLETWGLYRANRHRI